ncbi:hypothetical protein CYG49_03280 [Candidatus Saccharibacteria bacterium]|nr:MAG: hypothetical protein CYG49_03280 [Candidatus Saccharibacteria bacterium]
MAKAASNGRDIYLDELKRMISYAGLLLPLVVLAFGLLIRSGLFDKTYYRSDGTLAHLSIILIALGIWQFYTRHYRTRLIAIQIGLYHIVAALFILYVSGFNNPVLLCWIVLLVSTDFLLGRAAYLLSIVALAITAWLHVILHPNLTLQNIIEIIGVVVVVSSVGMLVSGLRRVSDREREAYNRTRGKEILQRDRLLTLINGMGDAVISTDSRGIVRVYNAAALSLLDTNRSLSGQSVNAVLNLVDENDTPINVQELIKQTKSLTVRRDLSHKYQDGESINLYVSLAPVRPNYQQRIQSGYIFVLRDITKEKSLEEERDEFISVVSHELRTPIAIAEGNLSNVKLLLERAKTDPKLVSAVMTAHDEVLYLAKMINDLSTLSRAERGVADVAEDINVSELITALFNEYRPQAEAKGLVLNLDLRAHNAVVVASRLYLEEILQNFLTNAIKYTKEGSITLCAHTSGASVEFAVADTGIGISKTDQKHVFEKFYRSEDYRTRETNGTGLGLYVVHKLAAKLSTAISLKSRLNHGSTFSFKMKIKGD